MEHPLVWIIGSRGASHVSGSEIVEQHVLTMQHDAAYVILFTSISSQRWQDVRMSQLLVADYRMTANMLITYSTFLLILLSIHKPNKCSYLLLLILLNGLY